MSVKLITFKTNHTIIAQVDCTDNNEVVLKQPVQVVMQPSKEGPMMAFAPFLDFSQEFNSGIKITMDNVLCITSPVVELENQYNQVFGSGIQIASAIPKV
jgi:hypothetical protein